MNSLSKNELEMKNQLKMNGRNELEMNPKNEPEMNEAIEMNNRNEIEMNLLEQIKRTCYKQTLNNITAIKLITDEPVTVLMKSIKRDIRNLNKVHDFLFLPVKGTVEIRLESNAIPIVYYFHCMDNYEAFAEKLIDFAEQENIQIKVIA